MGMGLSKTGTDIDVDILQKGPKRDTHANVAITNWREDSRKAQVPSSVSVGTMSDSEVSLWITRLIGSFGGCVSIGSRRNFLKKYVEKQEVGASKQPLPMSSDVGTMSFEDVSTLLINQIGSFAECKDEQSQRNLLKAYLRNKELKVPSSASVETMSDSEVYSWITSLIGSIGGCVSAGSRRNVLRKYLQKQEASASVPPPPLSSAVENMPFEEVSMLLIDQIGSFAECNDEQSQRDLLKTYLHNKELKGKGRLSDDTDLNSDYEIEHGSDIAEDCSNTIVMWNWPEKVPDRNKAKDVFGILGDLDKILSDAKKKTELKQHAVAKLRDQHAYLNRLQDTIYRIDQMCEKAAKDFNDIAKYFMEKRRYCETINWDASRQGKYSPKDLAAKIRKVEIQLYCAQKTHITDIAMRELEKHLTSEQFHQGMILTVKTIKTGSSISAGIPLIVICFHFSRLGVDFSNAVSEVPDRSNAAVLIFHLLKEHALPTQPSNAVLTKAEVTKVGTIIDVAFLEYIGLYDCEMNRMAYKALLTFIKEH